MKGSQEFLKAHAVNFAIESDHKVDGELTWKPLEKLFSDIGDEVSPPDKFGQMFTWAKPVA